MTITLARLATEFLERRGLSQSTQRSYELTLMPLLAQYGGWPIEIISRQMLSEYLESLAHLSITTHHRHQAIIQALFNLAVEQGYLTTSDWCTCIVYGATLVDWGSVTFVLSPSSSVFP